MVYNLLINGVFLWVITHLLTIDPNFLGHLSISKVGLCGSLFQRIGRVECHLGEVSGLQHPVDRVWIDRIRLWKKNRVLGMEGGNLEGKGGEILRRSWLYFVLCQHPKNLVISYKNWHMFFFFKAFWYFGFASQGFSLDVPFFFDHLKKTTKKRPLPSRSGACLRSLGHKIKFPPSKFWL